jgi:hypothetical protein
MKRREGQDKPRSLRVRELIQEAEVILAEASERSKLAPSYSRMNPCAGIARNVFFFVKNADAPSAVLFGPYVYLRGITAPPGAGFDEVSKEDRRRRHLAGFKFRLKLEGAESIRLLKKALVGIKKSVGKQ